MNQQVHGHEANSHRQPAVHHAPPAEPAKKAKAERVETKVQMEDGTEVIFVGKKRMLKDSVFAEDGTLAHVRFDFKNGKVIKFSPPTTLVWKFAAHGVEQKLGDEAAGTEDVDDMYEDILELAKRLESGEWSAERKGSVSGISILIKALMEGMSKTEEQVRAFLKDKTPAQRTALQSHAKIKPIFQRLQDEKAAKAAHINSDELLGQLEAI